MANNTLLASDDFASGSLAAGWAIIPTQTLSTITGSPFIAQPSTTAIPGRQMWTGLAFPNDQISEITLNALTNESGTQAELWLRVQPAAYSGYLATISSNGTNQFATIYRCDAGSFTLIGTAASSNLTIAVGDVFSFTVSGAALVVYQNYKQVLRAMDATYTSGNPGFGEQSTVNVTHVKIGSWRGYSTVQQDGIWSKKGVIITPLSGDFATSSGGTANSTMLYEANAQILSGTVYKMWFSAGAPAAELNCYYAESTDGITFTRYGSAVIAGQGSPFVIKSGSTYYLYTQPSGSNGVGNFSVYTSSDGLAWSVQATNILGALGGAGVWDGTVQWYFQPVAIIAGTWYGVYCADNTASVRLKIGLATSPDGIVWTKYVSNPVLTPAYGGSAVNSCALAKVGSYYYMWMFGNQPGLGGAPALLNPGEGVLFKTTDFITWTFVRNSVHRSQTYEGVNFVTGQCYPNSIFTVGGNTYMYIQSSMNDGGLKSIYQLSLATASGTIDQIITASEDATVQVATDAFARGAGALGANWTVPTGATAAEIASSGVVQCSAVSPAASLSAYTATSFNNDQYSEVTVTTMFDANNHIASMVRMATGALTGYLFDWRGAIGASGACTIYKLVSGSFTSLVAATLTAAVGDVMRLQVVGNVLSAFQNGFLVMQCQDVANAITSGSPGFRISPDATNKTRAQIGPWAGGNANVLPTYPSTGGAGISSGIGNPTVQMIKKGVNN